MAFVQSLGSGLIMPCMNSTPRSESESSMARWLPPAVIVVFASPCLFLGYLPRTDLPQHSAAISILQHLGNPAFDFDAIGDFYDYVLVREREKRPGVASLAKFPYDLIYSNPPWELYRHPADSVVE
jgi:hypothetical protein